MSQIAAFLCSLCSLRATENKKLHTGNQASVRYVYLVQLVQLLNNTCARTHAREGACRTLMNVTFKLHNLNKLHKKGYDLLSGVQLKIILKKEAAQAAQGVSHAA